MRLTLDPQRDIDAALLCYRRVFGVLALFSGVINLLMLVPSIYMMQVFDRVLTSRNETTLLMLTLILLGLYLLSSTLEWVRGQVMIKMSAGIDAQLGERVFGAAFERSLKEHCANPAQVLGDLTSIRQCVTGQATYLFDCRVSLSSLAGIVHRVGRKHPDRLGGLERAGHAQWAGER